MPFVHRVVGVLEEVVNLRGQIIGSHFRIGERRCGLEHMFERLPCAAQHEGDLAVDHGRRRIERGEVLDADGV